MPYCAFVSNDGSNEIQVIQLETGEEITRIPVPPGPFGMALTPDGQQLWAPLDVSRTVAIIDTSSGTLFRTVELPDDHLVDVAIHPDGKTVYVLSSNGLLYALDVTAYELAGVLGICGEQCERMRLTPDGTELWIADESGGMITIVDPGRFQILDRITPGQSAGEVAFTPDGHLALVADLLGSAIHLVDRESRDVLDSIDLDAGLPRSIALAPQGDLAYITLFESDQVLVLDLADGAVITELEGCFDGPNGLAVSPDGKTAVVVSQMNGAVCLVDLQEGAEARTIPFPGLPRRVLIGEVPALALSEQGRGRHR